ncbi:hypothetical protein [Pseudoalteromonas sp. MMG007]|uniref:hypothetical protein n=1 Tax=Pseudoalteromonas sp. MMG007 TaxID=2822684 RepID=UPI001B375DAC|nr:hypothetical protein [Pseudoalteromonas sp. MMG007]MBQ4857812.1 hypothetical protein [Pseudoalteromonas sp. MMG007]
MSTRRDRANDFKTFSAKSEDTFNGFWNDISKEDNLRTENDLNVCPKGAIGGLDETLIEIFFGFKYHSWQKELGDNFNVTNKAKIIEGARLEYKLTDKSHVICTLRPSKTENLRPFEDGIVLEILKEPSKLEAKSKQHWEYLVSYMRTTDVDGHPSYYDHLKTFWLRKTKRCFYNGKLAPRKISEKLSSVFIWAFTVGLSGALIFVITIWLNTNSENKVVNELGGIATELSSIVHNQEKLLNELETLKLITNNQKISLKKQDDTNDFLLDINRLTHGVSSKQFEVEHKEMRKAVLLANEANIAALENILLMLKDKKTKPAGN